MQPATDALAPSMPIEADAVIVGAGPAGLFQVFELGLLGIRAHVVDSLLHPGGQCTELYPDKPIYDIPALPVCGAQELVDRLMQQIKPFEPAFHLGQEVAELQRLDDGRFFVRTALDTRFVARTVVIAAGLGSFQPKKLALEGADSLEGRQLHYRVREAARFHGQRLVIFGGGDSALDWVIDFCGKAASLVARASPRGIPRCACVGGADARAGRRGAPGVRRGHCGGVPCQRRPARAGRRQAQRRHDRRCSRPTMCLRSSACTRSSGR